MTEDKIIFENNELFFRISFPELNINFSRGLLNAMKFSSESYPKTLEQYLELWNPKDISKIMDFQLFIKNNNDNLKLERDLYCGDGIYRTFSLNAFKIKNSSHEIQEIICYENDSLQIWLKNALEGDRLNYSNKILEAVSLNGVMFIKDVSEIIDLQQENLRLRREIQRRIFKTSGLPLLSGTQNQNFTIGVLGLKGCGKTSIINALLCEKIIPEENTASINIEIICRQGENREAQIFYQDGRLEQVKGTKLNSAYMKTFFAPKSQSAVSRIELTVKDSMLPEGVSIVDTPAINPLEKKVKRKNNKLIEKLLQDFDLIFYVIPIRYGLTIYDFEFLDSLLDMNKKIVIILSFSDIEKNDYDFRKISKTSQEKINYAVEKIKSQFKYFFKFSSPDVVAVSSKYALKKFYDRKSYEWENSNFDSLLNIIGNNTAKKIKNKKTYFPTKNFKNKDTNIFSSLRISMSELELRNRFLKLEAIEENQKIVLLSSDRDESMNLFSKLAHKNALSKLPEGQVSSSEWLYSGYVMPFPCIKLPLTGMNDDILIAPSDALIKENLYWENLFKSRVPVVSVDLWRYELGLNDLKNAPYFYALKNRKWVMSFGNGILFENEDSKFKKELIKNIELFIRKYSLKKPDIFIFEGYNFIPFQNV